MKETRNISNKIILTFEHGGKKYYVGDLIDKDATIEDYKVCMEAFTNAVLRVIKQLKDKKRQVSIKKLFK